jgi:hypothetical protein
MRKHYLVKLKLQIGGYEKISDMIITADNEEQAGQMAMALECHGNAHWGNNRNSVYDLGGEFAYSVRSTQELTDGECVLLSKYMSSFNYDEAQLNEMVDR